MIQKRLKLVLVTWTVGIVVGVVFYILRLVWLKRKKGGVRILLFKNSSLTDVTGNFLYRFWKPRTKKGLIVISNHPSLWEPLLIPLLFFPYFLFSLRFVPFSTPDKKNYDKWWFLPFKETSIFIDRSSLKGKGKAFRLIKKKLKEGGIVILFPEGGRTFKKPEKEEYSFSDSGEKKVRPFKPGLAKLIQETHTPVLQVWTEGGDKVMPNSKKFRLRLPRCLRHTTTIKVAEPIEVEGEVADAINKYLERRLLALGEE